ncbi:MAG: N-acetyltransferase [Bacteroides oleiciplenus]|nr:N-acetyltransferase [Bacteroides oleiciplenus]MBD9093171.1 N-acetyltransferase [Bacteroides oleiciplenus]
MDLNNIQIRETQIEDFNAIMEIHEQAFRNKKEPELVANLLADESGKPAISLLALYNGQPAGHILFTRSYFDGQQEQPMMHILAPLAVKPEFQCQGIGGKLIKAGIRLLQEKGSNLIFVLGHKEYYPQYGFLPHATRLGYPAPYYIPDELGEYWMVQPISKTGFGIGKGKIKCADAMNRPEYWRE